MTLRAAVYHRSKVVREFLALLPGMHWSACHWMCLLGCGGLQVGIHPSSAEELVSMRSKTRRINEKGAKK